MGSLFAEERRHITNISRTSFTKVQRSRVADDVAGHEHRQAGWAAQHHTFHAIGLGCLVLPLAVSWALSAESLPMRDTT